MLEYLILFNSVNQFRPSHCNVQNVQVSVSQLFDFIVVLIVL